MKTIYTCSKCDAQTPKWSGRCLECQSWGTLHEEIKETTKKSSPLIKFDETSLTKLSSIVKDDFPRVKTNIEEFDRLIGGGIVPGSLILLGGEPGIGKSTISLQLFQKIEADTSLLYISGEESAAQVKLRADRLKIDRSNLNYLGETNVEKIISAIVATKPALVIIDSIQTIYSSEVDSGPGSVTQIRATTTKLLQSAKETNTPIIITGHVTKDGAVAGPKTLEHLVDVVLYLEGDKYHGYRILRSVKNRFGSTNDIGIFEMTGEGLVEIKNPAKIFLENTKAETPGTIISCFAEGSRVFLIEIQALVSPTLLGYPQVKTSGFDSNRLQMLAAVINKRTNVNLNTQDIHLNIVGGFKVTEPAIDLAVCSAIISALKNKTIPNDTVIIGEIGLGGEIRNVQNLEKRLIEAEKLNFKNAIIPDVKLTKQFKIKLKKIKTISELLEN